jgi:ubiquinol-cytochrome c reductase cytochrome c subunit
VTRLLATVALALALPATAVAAGSQGQGIYAANCLKCHGAQGNGLRDKGPSLRGVGALSVDFYVRTGYMPLDDSGQQPRRRRSPYTYAQQTELIRYVAGLVKGPPVPRPHPELGSVSQGMKLFTEHCSGCHQVAAAGGVVTGARVPPLGPDGPVRIAQAVRIGPYLMPRFGTTQITDAELNSIIRYVQYAKNPDDRGGWALGHLGPAPEGLVTWFIAVAVLVATCIVIGERVKGQRP